MDTDMTRRARALAGFIIQEKATVRAAAKQYGCSKSTVHKDVTVRLRQEDRGLYLQVKAVLEENKAQRHIRGGLATREKYRAAKSERGVGEKTDNRENP